MREPGCSHVGEVVSRLGRAVGGGRLLALGALLAMGLGAGPAFAKPATIGISAGKLTYISPGSRSNQLAISPAGGDLVFQDPKVSAIADADGAGGCSVSGKTATCPKAGVESMSVDVGPGADTVTVDPAVTTNAEIMGGRGADTLTGGSGDDVLIGAERRDTLIGGRGNDTLMGGDANDRLFGDGDGVLLSLSLAEGGSDFLSGGDGMDVLNGGGGDDTLMGGPKRDELAEVAGGGTDWADYSDHTAPVQVSFNGTPDDGEAGENDDIGPAIENIRGGSGDDILTGDGVANTIDGGPGRDRIEGSFGFDTVDYSRATSDVRVTVGTGAQDDGQDNGAEGDTVDGFIERVIGGPGDDTLVGGVRAFKLDPFDGELIPDFGLGVIEGGPGDDVMSGNGGPGPDEADVFIGGPGSDTVSYAQRQNAVTATLDGVADDGAPGEGDSITSDVESVIGGSGADFLLGDDRENKLDGGPGNDDIQGLGGNDALAGGPGRDGLSGGSGADTISGGADDDRLDGGPDGDVLSGDGGDDTLDGGSGADAIGGGAGNDTGDYSNRRAPLTLTLDGTPGDGAAGENDNLNPDIERLVGGAANDVLVGGARPNRLEGGGGDDTLDGGGGPDTLIGGPGSDGADYSSRSIGVRVSINGQADDGAPGEGDNVADVENVTGGAGADDLVGDGRANALVGGGGGDRIRGGAGPDQIGGGAGNDRIDGEGGDDDVSGGAGNDTVRGGAGTDSLSGGLGDDTVVPGVGTFDQVRGGPGRDVASYAERSASVVVSLNGRSDDGERRERDTVMADVEGIAGGAGDDVLDSLDGVPGSIGCGRGDDSVKADPEDAVAPDCEGVRVRLFASARPKILSRSLRMSRGGNVAIRLSCPAGGSRCAGKLTLRAGRSSSKRRRTRASRSRVVGRAAYSIRSGRRRSVRVKLSRRTRRTVRRRRRLRIRAEARPDAARTSATVRRRLTIRAPRRSHGRGRR